MFGPKRQSLSRAKFTPDSGLVGLVNTQCPVTFIPAPPESYFEKNKDNFFNYPFG